jgi:hypothetical protein
VLIKEMREAPRASERLTAAGMVLDRAYRKADYGPRHCRDPAGSEAASHSNRDGGAGGRAEACRLTAKARPAGRV